MTDLSLAGRPAMQTVQSVGILELLGHHVASGRYNVAADSAAHDLAYAFGDARLALHQGMQIVGVKHQKPRARHRNDGGGTTCASQHGDFSVEVAGPEPDALLLELNLDFASG